MFVVLFFCNFFLRFTFFLHSKSSFCFKKRQITIMFLVNFLNGKIDHRFFSYKRKKKKKREIFWSEKQKEKKIEGGGHWFFCRFFRPGIFFSIFSNFLKSLFLIFEISILFLFIYLIANILIFVYIFESKLKKIICLKLWSSMFVFLCCFSALKTI